MPGVKFKYDNKSNEIYFSIYSDYYLYLGQILIDFEFQFKQSLYGETSKHLLTLEEKVFLINGIEKLIDNLIDKYFIMDSKGLNSKKISYKDKEYELFVHSSKSHSILLFMIQLYNFIENSIKADIDLIIKRDE